MMVLGPGYLVRAIFHYLKFQLVVSVNYFLLIESMEYFHLVDSKENSSLTRPTEILDNERWHVTDNLDPEPSSSDSLLMKIIVRLVIKEK